MIEAIIYNISVMVAGIYLFHRWQYSEQKNMVFSKNYVTILMTIVAILLAAYPIVIFNHTLHLTFVPILFLGRYTNLFYAVGSAVFVGAIDVLFLGNSLWYDIALVVIAGIVGVFGPFLKQNDIVSLQILNVVSLAVMALLALLSPTHHLIEIFYLVPISFVLTITSSIIFVDIWRFFSLIERYESEDTIDYLTGLGNVKEFDRHLNKAAQRAEDKQQSLGLLLLDIDGFKDVNDQYGHKAGDAVLKQVSQLLINYVPQQYSIFRNGGEEFSVVITDYTLDECVKLAESIRNAVKMSTYHLPNKEVIKLSVSIGVGYLTKEDRKSQRKMFKDADDMLHVAKNEGRDKVMFNPIIKL